MIHLTYTWKAYGDWKKYLFKFFVAVMIRFELFSCNIHTFIFFQNV